MLDRDDDRNPATFEAAFQTPSSPGASWPDHGSLAIANGTMRM